MTPLDLTDYVFIKEDREPKAISNTDHWGLNLDGFYIKDPVAGYVKKDYWELLQRFQNIKLYGTAESIEHSKTVIKAIKLGEVLTEDERLVVRSWLQLQNESGKFYNTVEEFNVIAGQLSSGDVCYKRTCALLGKQIFVEVKQNKK
jgi:hypothetical protein